MIVTKNLQNRLVKLTIEIHYLKSKSFKYIYIFIYILEFIDSYDDDSFTEEDDQEEREAVEDQR